MEEPLLRISSDFASGLKNKKNNRSKEMKLIKKNALFELKDFLILWSTQSVSQLGSSLTGFALTLWLYEKTGSSSSTAALTICTYAPYVLMSIFAGVLTDRLDKKKTMIVGSLAVSVLPKPKNRVRVIYLTMLFSLGTENFLLAFSREPLLWCIGQFIGWGVVPIMSANLDVILRTAIPVELQGRVYACRNTLQFFTIPIGLFVGGFMVDQVCEPFMGVHGDLTILKTLFGTGKGSGAALMMLILGINGSLFCIITGKKLKKY